ncbi:hypothetical protein DFH29DRAFT_879218 [Suillus ampliporus]|nr:hypothetical protein DFH29DRAFT_879218 [Suillus ampliporus]
MELPSSPSSTITAPPNYHNAAQRLAKMIVEAMTSSSTLLHYDNTSELMAEWCWPADGEGKRILPSNFKKYCDEHEFSGRKVAYVEVAVYPWWNNTMKQTHWTASEDRHLLQAGAFSRLAVPMKSHTDGWIDDKKLPIPPVQLKWTLQEQMQLLDRLAVCDVITVKEFNILFKCCKKCMQVAARLTMNDHICSVLELISITPSGVNMYKCNMIKHSLGPHCDSATLVMRLSSMTSCKNFEYLEAVALVVMDMHHGLEFGNRKGSHSPDIEKFLKLETYCFTTSSSYKVQGGIPPKLVDRWVEPPVSPTPAWRIQQLQLQAQALQFSGKQAKTSQLDATVQTGPGLYVAPRDPQNKELMQGALQTPESHLFDSWVIAGVEVCGENNLKTFWREVALLGIQSPLQIVYLKHLKNHNQTNIVPVHPRKIPMSTCLVTSHLFDDSIARTNIFQLSNTLGIGLLDAYIGLIANYKLQAEGFYQYC